MRDERISELQALAEKATPGPWWVRSLEIRGETRDHFVAANDVNGFAYGAEILGEDEYREKSGGLSRKLADCAFIAAANPETIKALLADLVELREALAFYRDEFKPKIHKKQVPGASGITFHPSAALLEDCGNRAMQALATPSLESKGDAL